MENRQTTYKTFLSYGIRFGLLVLLAWPVLAFKISTKNLEYHKISISECANADYQHNPYAEDPLSGNNHYYGLSGKETIWGKAPFDILPPYDKSDEFSIFVTGPSNVGDSCTLDLLPKKSKRLLFAIDGAWILTKQDTQIAEVRIHFQDGSSQTKKIVGNHDVWSYGIKATDSRVPAERLLWSNAKGRKIVVLPVTINAKQVPQKVEIFGLPAVGMKGRQPRFTVFAITQEVSG